MNITGIKSRLLFLALLPGSLMAAVLFVYFTIGQLQLVTAGLHERGVTIASQLGPASEYGVITGNAELLDQLTTSLMRERDIKGVSITDLSKNVIYAAGSLSVYGELPSPKETAELCGDFGSSLLFCAPIIRTVLPVSDYTVENDAAQLLIGAVYVELNTASVNRQRNEVIARATIITGLLLLMTGFFAVRVGASISRPLVQIIDTVRKVAGGTLDLNMVTDSSGEIGQLQHGIGTMIVSLRQAHDEMQANVDRATLQLRQALEELEVKNSDLDEQRLKAQAANEAKSRFLANMSHEIRTPLSGMVGLLFLLRHTKPTVEQMEYLDNLDSSAATLRTLIDDILDLSRIEAGKLVIHEQEFLLREQMTAIAVMLAPAAHQKDVEFIVHIERDVPAWVSGDPLRLRQVLTNLLGNAVKFTEKGHVRLHIGRIQDELSGSPLLRFVVEDSGIGIAKDKLDYIFESFAQADESTTRRYGGSGLGTTISRELVTLMGGRLAVTSDLGKGTVFSFDLPMLSGDEADLDLTQGKRKHVLLLEEHPLAAQAEIECLEAHGYAVTVAASEAALQHALADVNQRYDYILLAEQGRQCRWSALAQQLRTQTIAPAINKVAALTYYNSDCDTTPFAFTLHKPLDGKSVMRRWDELDGTSASERGVEAGSVNSASSPLRVLLAEDDPINARVMTFFLRQKGHEVLLANNGREALEVLRSRSIDIAFLDMRMPEMDGLMVARQWRSEELRGAHLPIVAVTANVTREDRNACFEAGMDDFVSKPIDPERLAALLQRYTRHKAIATAS